MKTFAVKRKRPVSAVCSYRRNSYQPVLPVQREQQTEVARILRSTDIQARLSIGRPNDKYEQEADRVADQVMRMPEPGLQRQGEGLAEEEEMVQAKPLAGQITPLVQRQAEPEEEEEAIQTKSLDNRRPLLVQRQNELEEGEEVVQTKSLDNRRPLLVQRQNELEEGEEVVQTKGARSISTISPAVESGIDSLRAGGEQLSQSSRAFFEPRFGTDFSGVRVHAGSDANNLANTVSAKAFTAGKDIFFHGGQYSPDTSDGRRLLAHELTHVVQQNHDEKNLLSSGAGSSDNSVVQRRVVTPSEIRSNVKSGDTNSAEIQGVRESIIDTLTEMYASNKAFVEGLFKPKITSVSQISTNVTAMGRKALIRIARKIIKADKSQKFTTKGYMLSVYKYKTLTKIRKHWRNLRYKAIQWIKRARSDNNMLQKVFGDGTVGSATSVTAATTAKANFGKAITSLTNTRKILFDSSGISGNLSLGGYANYSDQEIFMVIGKIGKPTRGESLTAAHEGMHLANSAITDHLGYASRTGSGFQEGSITGKLTNADHYAQVIAHKEGVGTRKPLPFKPRPAGAMPATPTTRWDTPQTEELRDEISTETRELWDATVDGFLESDEMKRKKKRYPDVHVSNASKLMNMTLHRANANYTRITDLDLSLAESTVKRVTALGDEADKFSRNTSMLAFAYILYKMPTPFNATTKKRAAFDIILDVAGSSSSLKPEDKNPTIKKHLEGLRNRRWRRSTPVW